MTQSSTPTPLGAPPDPATPPLVVRLEVPRHVWVVLVVVGLVVLGIAGVVIAQMEDTRTTINNQVGRLAQVERTTTRLGAQAGPVLDGAATDRADAKRLTGLSTVLARRALPLVTDLRAGDPVGQLEAVAALARDLEGNDAGRQLSTSADLARSLLGAGVGDVVRDIGGVATALRTAQLPELSAAIARLVRGPGADDARRLLARATTLLGDARAARLVPRLAAAARAVPVTIVPILRRVLALQIESVQINRETREIARDAAGHAANLDRKFGGDLPLPGAARGRVSPAP